MSRNREYELRFTISDADVERLLSHPRLRPGLRDRQVGRLASTYFDTPDGVLQRHNFGLRVRRGDGAITHTLKRTSGSLVDRGEWECAQAAAHPDLAWLRETPVEPLLRDGDVAAALEPRFSVDVTRTTFPLRGWGSVVEVALDQGAVAADGVSLPLSEVEFELKRGRPAVVLDLARALARDLPLVLSLATKAERGYRLGDLTWGRPTETIVPALRKRMTIAQAFEAIVQACLHVFLKNVALIEDPGDDGNGEALHKARIALRHLRAACQLFRPVLRRRRLDALRQEIKWLSDRLGVARDADVFQEAFYDPAAQRGDVAGAVALAGLMREHRRLAHDKLHAALASARARLLFIDLLAFSSSGVRRSRRRARCRPFVRKALDARRRKLARRAVGLPQQPVADMHEVRKAAKMLRYDLDLLAGAPKLAGGKRRRLGDHLKVLQKSLGALNDEEAMRAHLRETVLSSRPAGEPEALRVARPAAEQLTARRIEVDAPLRRAADAARHL